MPLPAAVTMATFLTGVRLPGSTPHLSSACVVVGALCSCKYHTDATPTGAANTPIERSRHPYAPTFPECAFFYALR
jgi:hypothetical protein